MSGSEGRMSDEVLMMLASKAGMDPMLWSLNEEPLGVEDMAAAAAVRETVGEDCYCGSRRILLEVSGL
jgi:hypothetical protein